MPSSDPRHYARFIPAEELGDVSQWRFGVVGSLLTPAEQDARQIEMDAERDRMDAAASDAFARGLEQGRAEAQVEAQRLLASYADTQGQQAAASIQAVLTAAQAELDAARQTIAQGVLDLACALARQVIRRELHTDPALVRHVAEEAVDLLLTDGRVATVRLHPDDLALVQDALRAAYPPGTINFIADNDLHTGETRVEGAGTVIDGSLQGRWQRAVGALGLPPARAAWAEPQHHEDATPAAAEQAAAEQPASERPAAALPGGDPA